MRRTALFILAGAIQLASVGPAGAAERDATWKLVSVRGTATAKVTNTSWFCRRTGGEGAYVTTSTYATDFRMRKTRGANIFGYGTRGPLIPFGSATPAFKQTTAARIDWNRFDTSTGAERPCQPQPQPACGGTATYNTPGLLIDEGSLEVRRLNRRQLAIGWPLIVHRDPDCSITPQVSDYARWANKFPVRRWKGRRRITLKIDDTAVIRNYEMFADAKYDVELTYRATAKLTRRR